MIAELAANLVQGLVTTSLAIVLVMCARRPWKATLGASALPWLWLMVPVACIAVWLPAQGVSMVHSELRLPQAFALGVTAADPALPDEHYGWQTLVMMLWFLGATTAACGLGIRQWRFQRSLGRLRPWMPGVQRAETTCSGPAVVHLLRPTIVVPADFEQRFASHEQALILEHERSHLQRGDIYHLAIANILRVVYWFNPLAHAAERWLRHDLELASDAAVMRRYPQARRTYAETLLNAQLAVPGLPVGCLWQSSHPLKERIMMLRRNPAGPATRRLALALGTTLALSLGALAWASQPGDVTREVAERPTHRVKLAIEHAGERSDPELHFAIGTPFAVEIGEGERRVAIDMRVERTGAGLELLSEVRQHGQLLASNRYGFSGSMNFTQLATGGGATVKLEGVIEPLSPSAAAAPANAAAATRDPGPRHTPAPEYPPGAKQAGIEGRVVVRADIDVDGRVSRATIVSAQPPGVFDETVRTSVLSWEFDPASKQGRAVPSSVEIPVCFALDDSDPCSAAPAVATPDGAS